MQVKETKMTGKVINTRLGDIEYSSTGNGMPIIFVHGGHSNCHETLCLKGFDVEKFQLITPSRPGYGKTTLKGNRSSRQAADLIIELLDQLSIDQVIVYGISAGGLTAIELAANYPNRVSKLILASAISKKWLEDNGKIYKTAQRIFNPKVEKFTWGMVRFFSSIFPTMIAKSFYPQFSKKAMNGLKGEDITELISAMKHYRSGRGFLNDIHQTIKDSTIAEIQCPTLIIHSRNDNSVPFEHALHAKKMIKNSKLVELDNEWGHLFWIGTDSMNSINKILKFIDE
ncbi:MAG: alpha/beta hydrolase [Cyclobacteriaceae bacterium]